MAYTKQTWTNVYGETPFTAERMGHIEDGIENTNKNVITASITDNYTIDSTGYKLLPLNTSVSVGNKLTLSNDGAIVVGAGVTKVLVSAKISFNNNATGLKWLTILLNNTSNGIIANPRNITARDMLYSTPTLIEINEGNKLYLGVNGAVDDVIRSSSAYTNITVEVVD